MRDAAGWKTGLAFTGMLCLGWWAADTLAAKPVRNTPPKALGSFTDHLDAFDSSRWARADGWKNGSPFDNAWRSDHVSFAGGRMELRLDDQAALGEPYTSGEYRSVGYHGYGCYEARFRPVRQSGAVTAFFTFAGPYDNGGNGKHNEIDVEFLGYDTRQVQFNFWTNDDAYAARNEYLHPLPFDAADDFHVYGFYWHAGGIRWYVDGSLVYEVLDSALNPTPKANESLQKIMMNLWPVDATAAAWAGSFYYPGEPLRAFYDWVRYTKDQPCDALEPPQPPPPPPGNATSMHVHDISMSLDARAMQAIARVTIFDGLGRPLPGARVAGSWSGAISSGDTARTTDSNGVAIFYSARANTTGAVHFCVSDLARSGYAWDESANREVCDTIVK